MKPLRGSRQYTFEIATRAEDGRWTILVAQSGHYSRTPEATARSIAERWILEQARRLPGGRLLVHGKRGEPPKSFVTIARILIRDPRTTRRLAAAYIGTDRTRSPAGPGSLPQATVSR